MVNRKPYNHGKWNSINDALTFGNANCGEFPAVNGHFIGSRTMAMFKMTQPVTIPHLKRLIGPEDLANIDIPILSTHNHLN